MSQISASSQGFRQPDALNISIQRTSQKAAHDLNLLRDMADLKSTTTSRAFYPNQACRSEREGNGIMGKELSTPPADKKHSQDVSGEAGTTYQIDPVGTTVHDSAQLNPHLAHLIDEHLNSNLLAPGSEGKSGNDSSSEIRINGENPCKLKDTLKKDTLATTSALQKLGKRARFTFDGEGCHDGSASVLHSVQSLWEIPSIAHLLFLLHKPLRTRILSARELEHAILHPYLNSVSTSSQCKPLPQLLSRLFIPASIRQQLRIDESFQPKVLEKMLRLYLEIWMLLPSPSSCIPLALQASTPLHHPSSLVKEIDEDKMEIRRPTPAEAKMVLLPEGPVNIPNSARKLFRSFLESKAVLFPPDDSEIDTEYNGHGGHQNTSSTTIRTSHLCIHERQKKAVIRARMIYHILNIAIDSDKDLQIVLGEKDPEETRMIPLGRDSRGRKYLRTPYLLDCRIYRSSGMGTPIERNGFPVGGLVRPEDEGSTLEVVCDGSPDQLAKFLEELSKQKEVEVRNMKKKAKIQKYSHKSSDLLLDALKGVLDEFKSCSVSRKSYGARTRKLKILLKHHNARRISDTLAERNSTSRKRAQRNGSTSFSLRKKKYDSNGSRVSIRLLTRKLENDQSIKSGSCGETDEESEDDESTSANDDRKQIVKAIGEQLIRGLKFVLKRAREEASKLKPQHKQKLEQLGIYTNRNCDGNPKLRAPRAKKAKLRGRS